MFGKWKQNQCGREGRMGNNVQYQCENFDKTYIFSNIVNPIKGGVIAQIIELGGVGEIN